MPPEWCGKSIGQLDIRKKHNINIMAVKKNGKVNMDITPSLVLREDENLLVLGKNKDIQRCFHI